jgi:hypothetical protein
VLASREAQRNHPRTHKQGCRVDTSDLFVQHSTAIQLLRVILTMHLLVTSSAFPS